MNSELYVLKTKVLPYFRHFAVLRERMRKFGKLRIVCQSRMRVNIVVVVGWMYNVSELFNSWVDQFWKAIAPTDRTSGVYAFRKDSVYRISHGAPITGQRKRTYGTLRVFENNCPTKIRCSKNNVRSCCRLGLSLSNTDQLMRWPC